MNDSELWEEANKQAQIAAARMWPPSMVHERIRHQRDEALRIYRERKSQGSFHDGVPDIWRRY